MENIELRLTPGKGRGVYATKNYKPSETIEVCPVIPIPANQVELIKQTNLKYYYFEWGEKADQAAIVLGYGSIYNHSRTPNAEFIFDEASNIVRFVSLCDIIAGTEICTQYVGDNDPDPDFL